MWIFQSEEQFGTFSPSSLNKCYFQLMIYSQNLFDLGSCNFCLFFFQLSFYFRIINVYFLLESHGNYLADGLWKIQQQFSITVYSWWGFCVAFYLKPLWNDRGPFYFRLLEKARDNLGAIKELYVKVLRI